MVARALSQDDLKREAAHKAASYVKSGDVVGLGTGSTAAFAVDRLGDLLASGQLSGIVGVPTSTRTRDQATARGIPLATLDECPALDVAIDGADEVDPRSLDVVKGRGGALLREKMVERAARAFVCIVDETKLVQGLGGSRLAVPIEIVKFCHLHTARRVLKAATEAIEREHAVVARLRAADASAEGPIVAGNEASGPSAVTPAPALYETDNGNHIVDLYFQDPIPKPAALADALAAIEGVVEHGFFLGMVDVCIVAGKDGVQVLDRKGDE